MKRVIPGVAVLLSMALVSVAVAQPPKGKGLARGPGWGRLEGVERTVTKTETGVTIEITSDDPEVVEAIQARHAEPRKGRGPRLCEAEGVERTVTETENGVLIAITSEDPELVETIQARAAEGDCRGPGKKFGRWHGRKGPGRAHARHERGWWHQPIEGVERNVAETDNGVAIEITSDDPAVVEKIQARFAEDKPERPGKGLKRMRGHKGDGKRVFRRGGFGRLGWMDGVERNVTNTDNGVWIEITSEDPEAVEMIQDRFERFGEGGPPPGAEKPCTPSDEDAPEDADAPSEAV
jgi:TusA-related sulfurtransferase